MPPNRCARSRPSPPSSSPRVQSRSDRSSTSSSSSSSPEQLPVRGRERRGATSIRSPRPVERTSVFDNHNIAPLEYQSRTGTPAITDSPPTSRHYQPRHVPPRLHQGPSAGPANTLRFSTPPTPFTFTSAFDNNPRHFLSHPALPSRLPESDTKSDRRSSFQSATSSSSLVRPDIAYAKRRLSALRSAIKARRDTRASKIPFAAYPVEDEMSMFAVQLTASVEVVYEQGGKVDMLGGTNTGSNYSLPGHVVITLPAVSRQAVGKRSFRELRELKLVVETMSEYFDDAGRYTPMRVFKSTIDLVKSDKPIVIPHYDEIRPFEQKVTLAIPFDLRLPGWLPPTIVARLVNVAHGTRADAIFAWDDLPPVPTPGMPQSQLPAAGPSTENWMMIDRKRSNKVSKLSFDHLFVNSWGLPRPNSATVIRSKFTPFAVHRHRIPGALSHGARIPRTLTSRPFVDETSPVEVIMTIPEWVDVNGDPRAIKVQLRIRANLASFKEHLAAKAEEQSISASTSSTQSSPDLSNQMPGAMPSSMPSSLPSMDKLNDFSSLPMQRSGSEQEPLTYVQELGMEVEETERYNSQPIHAWTQAFPTPEEQPDRSGNVHPLITPRSSWADYPQGVEVDSKVHRCVAVRQCLLAEDGSQRNFFFKDEGLALDHKWRKVNVVLPMPSTPADKSKKPKSELDSPFLRVRHMLKLRIVCQNAVGDNEATKTINITVPIRFGTMPATCPDAIPPSQSIPPYVQLFYENGDLRECDPLPLYVPRCETDQPPPFSPIDAHNPVVVPAPQAALPAPRPVRRASVDELPGPGEIYRSGSPESRPSSPPTEEDDPMDGSYEVDNGSDTSNEENVAATQESEPDLSQESRPADPTPPLTRRIAQLQLPAPPMLPEPQFPGAISPVTPRAHPYPSAGPSSGSSEMDVDGASPPNDELPPIAPPIHTPNSRKAVRPSPRPMTTAK